MRFDAIGGTLRSDARVSWALDKKARGQEGNLTGMEFVGEPEMTESVREFLTGGRMTLIESERGREFKDLTKRKEKETARAKARTVFIVLPPNKALHPTRQMRASPALAGG